MELKEKISRAACDEKLYNLDHMHLAWTHPSHKRMMGNELLYPPSPKVIAAIKSMAPYVNFYAEDPSTNKELLKALAEYVGIKNGEDWVTLGNGSTEVIDMIPHAFINPGDEILLPAPDYALYTRRPRLYGAKIVDVFPDANFEYVEKDFFNKITSKTKMIIMSRPNAPVGNLIKKEIIERLCESDCIVVVDEAYAEFSEQNICDLIPKYKNLIVLRTFSKAFGLAGIRLGFVIANPEAIGYINRVRRNSNISLLTQAAAQAALKDIQYIRNNIRLVIKSRDWFQKEIAQVDGIKVFPSKGNYVLLNVDGTGKSANDFVQHLWDKGFIVRNFTGGRNLKGKGFFRITVGTQDDMNRIVAVISDYAKANIE